MMPHNLWWNITNHITTLFCKSWLVFPVFLFWHVQIDHWSNLKATRIKKSVEPCLVIPMSAHTQTHKTICQCIGCFLFPPSPPSSAQLKPGGWLDGVQQFVPHHVLVAELWELQQVHASAGGGQAVQVGAAVVDAEHRVKLLQILAWTKRLINTNTEYLCYSQC